MYLPKSMRKKLPPGFNLNFDLNKIMDKLLNKVFGVVDKALATKSKKSGVPGVTLSDKDVEIFTTRNLQVFAMNKEDLEKGDFDKAKNLMLEKKKWLFIRQDILAVLMIYCHHVILVYLQS